MITLHQELRGMRFIQDMLKKAPRAITAAIRHWLYSERKRFIGNKQIEGKFRRQLMRLRSTSRGPFKRTGRQTWDMRVVHAFKGRLENYNSLRGDLLEMRMGLRSNTRKGSRYFEGLEMMEKSYSGNRSIHSSKYMPIPLYKNINNAGFDEDYELIDMMNAGKLAMVKRRDRLYYYLRGQYYSTGKKEGEYKRKALMFLGVKKISLKPRFDFYGAWNDHKPSAINHGARLIKECVRGLELGYVKENK